MLTSDIAITMSYSNLSQMSFKVSDKQRKFLNMIDKTCKSLRQHEEVCYVEEKSNNEIIPKFSKIGMLGCPVSRNFGGLGYDILTYILAMERIGEEGSSLRTFFSTHTSIGQLVLQNWGDDCQKREYLPNTCSGRNIMAFALTEPLAGSDPSSMITKFEDKGEHFLLNGKKHWIGNGTIADVLTTYARESGGTHHGKISAFIVDGDSRGISKNEIKNKLGLLSIKNAEINFDNCIVPKKNILGMRGEGLNIAYSALIDGRLSVAAGSIGVMKGCLEETIKYSKTRWQHGSSLAKKQLIQRHLSRIAINIESCRWLVYRAAVARQILHDYVEQLKSDYSEWLLKLKRDNGLYCKLRSDADFLATMAKLHASNSAFDSANRSVPIFGSSAYTKSSRVARHSLDSRATTIYEGTNEVLQLKIASNILGDKYKAY